jgi:uncharacterized MAPEG superfamily protein
MTTAYWCVFAAAMLPYAFTSLAKFTGAGRYDNHAPRDWLDRLEGWRKRAHWAQLNSFEAFAPFAAAVIIAQQSGAPQGRVDALAAEFVALRSLYGALYVIDQPKMRSFTWGLAFTCTIALFLTAAGASHDA